jgi:hypothetical protein
MRRLSRMKCLVLSFSAVFLILFSDGEPSATDRVTAIQQRKRAFLERVADEWIRAGEPGRRQQAEQESDEGVAGWSGALATLWLARSEDEALKANAFFESMAVAEGTDVEAGVGQALHAYYLFRDRFDLSPVARKRLLDLFHLECPPFDIASSTREFEADGSRGFWWHTLRLLVAQLDRDRKTAEGVGRDLQTLIVEDMKRGYEESGSPGRDARSAACLIMLAEWAEDPLLRKKAGLGLDVLFAERAARGFQDLPGERSRAGILPMTNLLFGPGEPGLEATFEAAVLATSEYAPPEAVHYLATAGSVRVADDDVSSLAPFVYRDRGIVKLRAGPHRLTINVARDREPVRIEETIQPLALPYESDCDQPGEAWMPFLNYWRLKPEQWYWDSAEGRSGGCLRHESSLGVLDPKRGAHDAAILLRGGEDWSDYVFEADAYGDRGHFGLWARADMHDEAGGNGRWVQGYYFVLDPAHHKCRLWRARLDGLVLRDNEGKELKPEENHFSNPLLLAEAATPDSVTHGRWLRLRVELRGKMITAAIDDEQVLAVEDDLYSSGSVGLTTYKGQGIRFDNIRVSP